MRVMTNKHKTINQLALLVVSGRQSNELMDRLRQERYYFTIIDSSGGVIQEPAVCLLVGLNSSRTEHLLKIIRRICQPTTAYIPSQLNFQTGIQTIPMIEAQVGGALVHILDVERFIQI